MSHKQDVINAFAGFTDGTCDRLYLLHVAKVEELRERWVRLRDEQGLTAEVQSAFELYALWSLEHTVYALVTDNDIL